MALGSGIRKKPIRIPDPGSRGQKGPGSRIWIRNTAVLDLGRYWHLMKYPFRYLVEFDTVHIHAENPNF
jgi:hypothetical protein